MKLTLEQRRWIEQKLWPVAEDAARAFAFPASLTGSVLKAGTAATAQTVFSCKKNGAEFGTITVAASGTTAIFIVLSATTLSLGDEVRRAPAMPSPIWFGPLPDGADQNARR